MTVPVLTPQRRQSLRSRALRTHSQGQRIKHVLALPGALGLLAFMFADLIGSELQLLLDSHTEVLVALGVLGASMLLIAHRWAVQVPEPLDGGYGNDGTGALPRRRGLVLLVGLDSGAPDSDAAVAFASMPNLEYVAFVGTPATADRNTVNQLVKVAAVTGIRLPETKVRRWEFAHAESVSGAEESVAEALRWLIGRGLHPSEIVVDVSAGRRAMGYGAKDAADEHLVEAHYLAAAWDGRTNQPVPGSRRFKILKQYH